VVDVAAAVVDVAATETATDSNSFEEAATILATASSNVFERDLRRWLTGRFLSHNEATSPVLFCRAGD
jgi:hypothetical protein